jgi:hypothetical protein
MHHAVVRQLTGQDFAGQKIGAIIVDKVCGDNESQVSHVTSVIQQSDMLKCIHLAIVQFTKCVMYESAI